MTTEPKDYARVKFKQLTLQERLDIATCLSRGFNLTDTAKFIDCSISTVKKEIDRNKYLKVNERFKNKCGFKLTCDSHNVCSNYQCTHLCSDCRYSKINCNTICKQFTLNPQCKLLKKHCGVCNGCHKKDTCKLNKWFYNPNDSQIKHEANISDAHKGSFITKDEANNLAMTIKSNLSKNISISVIKNKFNIKYSVQSIYNWINDGILPGVNNLNLLRKVKYKQRKKKENKEDSYNRDYLIGRYYDDFIQYTIDHPNDEVVEMDCVEGKGHSSAIMTLLFRRSNFMLAFKLKNTIVKVLLKCLIISRMC